MLIGLLISNFAKTYDSAAPITSAIGLPLTFLGSIFYPLTVLPHALQTIAKILPITYLADGLRQSYLYAFDFQKIGFDILILTRLANCHPCFHTFRIQVKRIKTADISRICTLILR